MSAEDRRTTVDHPVVVALPMPSKVIPNIAEILSRDVQEMFELLNTPVLRH
jgi:hypothetical protein